MSYYYKYRFTSPESIFATVKEELKSYFDTGACDDLLFPTYVDKCLKKLGRASFVISETILHIDNYEARLPDNFYAVREAWLCADIQGFPYQSANSFYSQAASASTIQVTPMTVNGQPCTNPDCVTGCDECMPNIVQAVYKTNSEVARSYRRTFLLKPGNISALSSCTVGYIDNWEAFVQATLPRQFTPNSSSYDSFDIRGNKFVTNFREGVVDMVFYSRETDEVGNQLVPDNYRIKEYIEAFIKYKMFELLSNQNNDETFNQLREKLQYYKQLADEAYVLAEVEIKKQTPWEKQRRIKKSLNRLNMYELPDSSLRYKGRYRI